MATVVPVPEAAPRLKRRGRRRLLDLLSLVLIVAIFGFVLPRIASYREVAEVLTGLGWAALLGLVAIAVWNLATYWILTVAVLPSLRMREAAVAALGSTAIANTLPAGAALGMGVTWRMFASWGVRSEDFALYTLVSGVWNQFVKLGMPLVALLLLVVAGRASPPLVTAAIVGVAVLVAAVVGLALVLHSDRLARAVGLLLQRLLAGPYRLVRRPPPTRLAEGLVDFRSRALLAIEARGWWITAATLVSHVTLWLVLLVCLRACGVSGAEVPWQETLAAFAFVRLLTALPITPGGLGVVELGLTGPLAAGLDAEGAARVAAGVLLYRALTYLLPIPLGALALLWWRVNRSWRMSPAERSARRARGPKVADVGA